MIVHLKNIYRPTVAALSTVSTATTYISARSSVSSALLQPIQSPARSHLNSKCFIGTGFTFAFQHLAQTSVNPGARTASNTTSMSGPEAASPLRTPRQPRLWQYTNIVVGAVTESH